MASCKCKNCQAKLTTNNAYKVCINNKSAYFCNKEHYIAYEAGIKEEQIKKMHTKNMVDKFYNLICEILCVNGITNTAIWKEKAEINKVFSDEIIIEYLENNKAWLTRSISNLDSREYGKIRYLSAILKNNLGDYRTNVVEEKPKILVDNSFYEPIATNNNKRRSLADLEDDF